MKVRAVVRQKRSERARWDVPFIADQCVYLTVGKYIKYRLGDLVEVRYQRQYMFALIVGMGWEGDDFVIHVL